MVFLSRSRCEAQEDSKLALVLVTLTFVPQRKPTRHFRAVDRKYIRLAPFKAGALFPDARLPVPDLTSDTWTRRGNLVGESPFDGPMC